MTLPQVAQLEWNDQELVESIVPKNEAHHTFAWDFTTGDFMLTDGKLIPLTGLEYVKGWIQKCLHTILNSLIYVGTDYGSEHHVLIGRNFHPEFSRAEYERMIREALLKNDAIKQVDHFVFSQDGAKLTIQFVVESSYGQVREGVTIGWQ